MKVARAMMCVCFSAVIAGSVATTAKAQAPRFADTSLPSTVRVIVPYAAGGGADAVARVTAPYWERSLEDLTGKDVSVVVVNQPGAGGEIGFTAIATAEPDGSTIGMVPLPSVALVAASRETQFAPWLENFVPLAVDVVDPNIIRLGQASQYADLKEAVEAAKQEPGSVIVGADGPLSDDHLAAYGLERTAGAQFAFIPYDGGSLANRALRSGEIDLAIGNLFDYLQTEDITKDAAVFQSEVYPGLPDVEPVAEKFGVEIPESGSTRGFLGPAGMPEDLVTLYREAFRMAFDDPEYAKVAKERNLTRVRPRIGEEFGRMLSASQKSVEDNLDRFMAGGFIKR